MRFANLLLTCATALSSMATARAQFNQEWLTQYGKTGDWASAIVVDSQGRSWTTGFVSVNVGNTDMSLSRFSNSGALEFTRTRGGGSDDAGRSVTILGSDTVLVGGETNSNTFDGHSRLGSVDAFLARFDSSGVWQQTSRFGGNDVDGINASAAQGPYLLSTGDTRSNPFEGQTNAGGYDVFITKRDSAGTPVWTRLAGTAGNELPSATAANAAGDALVAGYTDSSFNGFTYAGGDNDMFIARYDSGGLLTWLKQFGTTGNEAAIGAVFDKAGNIYLAGETTGAFGGETNSGGADGFVMKLDANGAIIWSRLFGGLEDDEFSGLGLDDHGHIFVAGSSKSSIGGHQNHGGSDILLAAYDTDGVLLGSTAIGTVSDDFVSALAIGPDGKAYITGQTDGLLDPNATQPGLFAAEFALVPEPSSAIIAFVGGLAFLLRRRKH